ncbi:hypothetical protein CPB97_010903 [Podila verticillata]|nr:hypothetical protein CPB97_010903 [Podila verticillata]
MDPPNLTNAAHTAPAGAPTSAPTANIQVGGVGVPGAQVELLDSNIQPQNHHLDQHPVEYAKHHHQQQQYQQQYQPQGQFFSQPATTAIPPQEAIPQQFQQSYQQSFFTQPEVPKTDTEGHPLQSMPSVFTTSTNSTGTGDPGLHVGGVGILGAQAELLPATLDTIGYASASRPPVGPFDPPTQASVPPMIQIQREDSMRGHPTPPPTGQYNPGQTVAYDPQTPHHDGGNINMASSSTNTTTTTTNTTDAPHKIHIASAEAVAAANAADAQTRGRRRSSLAVLAGKLRSMSRSRSRGDSRSPSTSRRLSRTLSNEEDEEPAGPYADVKQAQQAYITKLRAEQERDHITTNADGLPIPPQQQQRRRSSVARVLGLDKPLLSR